MTYCNYRVIWGRKILPCTWNIGMMEYWNVDFKGIISSNPFIFSREISIIHHPIFSKPIIPAFQYSSIPIVRPGGSRQVVAKPLSSFRSLLT